MAKTWKLDKPRANRIALAVVDAIDSRGHFLSMRENLTHEFAGAPPVMLAENERTLIQDDIRHTLKARGFTPKSVVSRACVLAKVTRCWPVVQAMPAKYQKHVADFNLLAAFCTKVQKADGDWKAAIAETEANAAKPTDNKKKAGRLCKALLNLDSGKFFTRAQKVELVAFAVNAGLTLGKDATPYLPEEKPKGRKAARK